MSLSGYGGGNQIFELQGREDSYLKLDHSHDRQKQEGNREAIAKEPLK
jgi:hypothetical protein